jgi:SAM-dependent methyltransferase
MFGLPTRECATKSTPDEYFRGNSAKTYCCAILDSLAAKKPELSVLDLGCGKGTQLIPLLRRHPRVEYVGVEPDPRSAAAARAALQSFRARVVESSAESYRSTSQVDCIVSFSVFEHVVHRERYFRSVAENLSSRGIALLNYDSGHFLVPAEVKPQRVAVSALRGWAGRSIRNFLVASFGMQHEYQRFVESRAISELIDLCGLEVIEARSFNTALKTIAKHVPSDRRIEFERRWLDTEMWLDDAGVQYDDSLAGVFTSRNLIIRKRNGART